MNKPHATFESLVKFLNSEPSQQAVVRNEHVKGCNFTLKQVSKATGRAHASTYEYYPATPDNMLLRDKVWILSPQGAM